MKFAQVIKVTEQNRNSKNIQGKILKGIATFKQVTWELIISDPSKTVCPYSKEELTYSRKKNGKKMTYTLNQEEEVEHISFTSGNQTPPLWMIESARIFNENPQTKTSDDLRNIVKEIHPTARIQ